MKAVLFTEYGLPDVLELKEVEKPIPLENEVLIVRTYFEDQALLKELDGYSEYGKKTPYRLIPGV